MELAIICLAAFIASGLTLFSGFGLGTLLMPVVAVFFPLEVAVAMTAVVHLANNLFKLLLLGRGADARVLLRFGIPAVLFAWIGAALLVDLSVEDAAIEYSLLGHAMSTSGPESHSRLLGATLCCVGTAAGDGPNVLRFEIFAARRGPQWLLWWPLGSSGGVPKYVSDQGKS